ncbi:MAG: outer membrane beta-barrel protein [Proteobacteria bacterium]|nr:outer membrane beta-barrel protein [Pseudomonadota bacterium]
MLLRKAQIIILLAAIIAGRRAVLCSAESAVTVVPNFLFNQQLIYDSNYYYLPEKERSVTTYLVQPGFELGIETAKSLIAMHYTLNAHYYNQKGEDNFYGHTGLLLGEVELTDRLNLDLKNRFIYSRDSGQLDPIGTPASREKYYQNRFKTALSYHFEPKFTVQAGYQNWITDYKESELEDAVGNQGSIDLIYHLNRSAALDLEYQYWKMDYDDTTPDYTSQLLSLIARKEWRLIAMEAGFGYHNRDFDESGLKDNDTFIYRLTLDGTSTSGRTRYSVSGQQNYNYLGFHSNDYYKANRFSGKLDYDATVRISTGIEGSYQNDDYVNSSREDDIYAISADAGYLIKEWLELLFSVGYEQRDSNISSEEYNKILAVLELRVDYDLGKD